MANKKKVLLISPSSLNNGGVQYVFMTIVRNFHNVYDFDIIVFNQFQNFYKDEFLSYGGKIYLINVQFENRFKNFIGKIFRRLLTKIKFKTILKENHYDIIHCMNQFDSDIILKTSYKYKIQKRICRAAGCYPNKDPFTEFFRNKSRKKIIKYATDLTGVSPDSCKSFYGLTDNFKVIDNPSNESIFFNRSHPQKLTLVQIGLFTPNKNQSFTLDVFYELKQFCDCNLILVGTGNNQLIKNKIVNLNLGDSVVFYESNCDKNLLFSQSSYLIFPSFAESFGNVLIEAQKSGLYCFASDGVPTYANCGGVTYLSLKSGAKYWAEVIYKQFMFDGGEKHKFDTSKFSTEEFIKNINELYH